ncbi:intraflagellar transport protein 74 homolog, partial [Tachysurus ichikawai]
CERLQQDLLNVERLEGKVQAEMNSLKEKIQEMSEGLKMYRDLDALKASGDQKMKVADSCLCVKTVIFFSLYA